jgi:hypothetical protein
MKSDFNKTNKPPHSDLEAFWQATVRGRDDVVEAMLDKYGPQLLSRRNRAWMTGLMFAAANGHASTAQLLLDRGAEIGATNKIGETASYLAARSGHNDVSKLIMIESTRRRKAAEDQAAAQQKLLQDIAAQGQQGMPLQSAVILCKTLKLKPR